MTVNAKTGSLHSVLFTGGRQLENFKFFRGTRPDLTSEELKAAASCVVSAALARGLIDNVPSTGRAKSTI